MEALVRGGAGNAHVREPPRRLPLPGSPLCLTGARRRAELPGGDLALRLGARPVVAAHLVWRALPAAPAEGARRAALARLEAAGVDAGTAPAADVRLLPSISAVDATGTACVEAD